MTAPVPGHLERDGFRLRGLHMSRVDGFSDVVFGFALTLLVVSLEVPKTYAEFELSLRGFLPFAVSFLFLMMIWYAHYKYFRRFGTHDFRTIAINAALLFVVLFYVYPLKFLFTFLAALVTGANQNYFETNEQVQKVMILFGVGFATLYFLVGLLYANGYRQRDKLELTQTELVLARSYMVDAFAVGSVGLISCAAAAILSPAHSGYSGLAYWLIWIVKVRLGSRTRKRLERQAALYKLTATPLAGDGSKPIEPGEADRLRG